jgi:hypothetical protein
VCLAVTANYGTLNRFYCVEFYACVSWRSYAESFFVFLEVVNRNDVLVPCSDYKKVSPPIGNKPLLPDVVRRSADGIIALNNIYMPSPPLTPTADKCPLSSSSSTVLKLSHSGVGSSVSEFCRQSPGIVARSVVFCFW